MSDKRIYNESHHGPNVIWSSKYVRVIEDLFYDGWLIQTNKKNTVRRFPWKTQSAIFTHKSDLIDELKRRRIKYSGEVFMALETEFQRKGPPRRDHYEQSDAQLLHNYLMFVSADEYKRDKRETGDDYMLEDVRELCKTLKHKCLEDPVLMQQTLESAKQFRQSKMASEEDYENNPSATNYVQTVEKWGRQLDDAIEDLTGERLT